METALGTANWLLGKVINKLSDDLVRGYVASHEFHLNYDKIETELLCTRALLHEAQQGHVTNNPGLQVLLEKLSKKADEAEVALDELHYFMIQDKLDGTREATPELGDDLRSHALHGCHSVRHAVGKNFLSSFSLSHKQDDADIANYPRNTKRVKYDTDDDDIERLPFDRVAMSTKIKSMIEDIHSLCHMITPILQLHCNNNPQRMGAPLKRPPTSSTITQDKLYGRDVIFSETINDMTSGIHLGTLSVLPIVGPGGIGKTTFAQHLYSDKKTKEHFAVRIWVCVSVNFDVLKLTQEIRSCILAAENECSNRPAAENEGSNRPASENEGSNRANDTTNLSLLHESIAQRLKYQRLLLVLDDMWDCNNKGAWDTLLTPFRKGETKGNMVLVTTRFPKIANMVKEGTNPINLQGLESDGFWKFFQNCIFGEVKDEQDKDDLIGVAKAISDKLKCSPLAAKTVGPLLRKNHSREHWIGILNKKEWANLKHSDDNIMPALKISYDFLPFHLKKCFSYCALFPEDHRFDNSELTRFWDAIGIIDTSSQIDRAEDLVDELVDNGFLIKQYNGWSQYYVLHDLLHELSQNVSSQECINISFSGFIADNIPPSVRHVSITIDNICFETLEEEMSKLKTRIDIGNLRTLMIFQSRRRKSNDTICCYGSERIANVLKGTFNKIKNLRVLVIFMNSPKSLPHNFSKLIHLRYLKIGTVLDSVSLPSAISRFYHLNFLNLEDWNGRNDVPKDFNRLVNLRQFCGVYGFHSNVPGVGKMECLEVLNKFHVKKESVGFELAELGKLTKLRESLGICSLEKVRSKEEAEEAKLQNKSNLRKLRLNFSDPRKIWLESSGAEQTTGHDAIEGLRPHPSLRELEIERHRGVTGPSWLCRDICVTSLECLSLSYVSWDVLPPFGRLPFLRSLSLERIRGLRQFRLDSGGIIDGSFRHFKSIRFSNMPDLVVWVGGDNSHLFSKLEDIGFWDCHNLTTLPFSDCNGPSTEGTDITWLPYLPYLRDLHIVGCPKLSHLPPIPYTSTLTKVRVNENSLLYESNDNSLIFNGYPGALVLDNLGKIEYMSIENAPHILLTDLQMLNSLKELTCIGNMFCGEVGDNVVLPSVQKLTLKRLHPTRRLLSNVLKCLPALSELKIQSNECQRDVALQFPSSSLLCKIKISCDHNLVLSAEDGGAFRHLTSLQSLSIKFGCKIFSRWSLTEASQNIKPFPASLRELRISRFPRISMCGHRVTYCPVCATGPRDGDCTSTGSTSMDQVPQSLSMGLLSNLTSLTALVLDGCDDLTTEGFNPFIIFNLKSLMIHDCGSLAADVFSEVARSISVSACSLQLEHLTVNNIAGVLVAPVCSRLSATLRTLSFYYDYMIERFTEEQEKALQFLTALEELEFCWCIYLQSLPEAIHRLCSLRKLVIRNCRKIQCLPKSGLPVSLKSLGVEIDTEEFRIELVKLSENHPDLFINPL